MSPSQFLLFITLVGVRPIWSLQRVTLVVDEATVGFIEIDQLRKRNIPREAAATVDVRCEFADELLHETLDENRFCGSQIAPLSIRDLLTPFQDSFHILFGRLSGLESCQTICYLTRMKLARIALRARFHVQEVGEGVRNSHHAGGVIASSKARAQSGARLGERVEVHRSIEKSRV